MITITQDLPNDYPAFNDSFIKFSSSIAPTYATIQINSASLGLDPFKIYPDPSGNFVFNLRNVAKASFDNKRFEIVGESSFIWGQHFQGFKTSVDLTIKTFNGGTSDTLNKVYTFKRAVNQIGEELRAEKILTDSKNGLDYALKYWEGYPFDFQLSEVTNGENVIIKNRNTGIDSAAIPVTASGSMALHVDKVSDNWSNTSFLPVTDTKNRLEIYKGASFYANLELDKRDNCEGVYLRWFNNKGGVNYWLFEEYETINLSSKNGEFIGRNDFMNIGQSKSKELATGKMASKSLKLETYVDKDSIKTIESLFLSPNIELYTSKEPFVSGVWLTVSTESNLSLETKPELQKVSLTVDLPETYSLTL